MSHRLAKIIRRDIRYMAKEGYDYETLVELYGKRPVLKVMKIEFFRQERRKRKLKPKEDVTKPVDN